MKQIYSILALSIFSLSHGQIVNPVSATTTFTAKYSTELAFGFNGAGLASYPSLTANHVASDTDNCFVANETTGSIDFNLGGVFNIDGIALWNINEGGPPSGGVNGVNFYYSLDGVTYTLIPGGPTTVAQVNIAPAPAQTFTFTSVSAAYIRMTVLSNFGADTGFAEIAFASGGVLSVKSFTDTNSIAIYPNPSSDFLKLNNLKDKEDFSIINNLGQEVKNGTITTNENIDIQSLSTGIYYLKLKRGKTIKFVKK